MIGCGQTFIDHLKKNDADFDQSKFVKILRKYMSIGAKWGKKNEVE